MSGMTTHPQCQLSRAQCCPWDRQHLRSLATATSAGHAGPSARQRQAGRDAHVEDLILTVRARRLMKEIRRLRTAAGLTVARAAKQLEISEATLWRMENGKTRISTEVLVAMLDLYDVRSPQPEALERLALDPLRRGRWAPCP